MARAVLRPLALLAAMAAACSSGAGGAEEVAPSPSHTAPAGPRAGGEGGEVPLVTPEEACVPPDEIYFDTFGGGAVPFSEASPDLILSLRDAIPPLTDPRFEGVSGGDWLAPDDLVLGFAHRGRAFAYPFKILNFHEIVNQVVEGDPVLVSYCPLCGSGIVFRRELDGRVLHFGNTSALFESDLVMFDRETGSYWQQVGGVGIVGELCGRRLTPLPSITATWAQWKALHPDTRVLSRRTGFARDYEVDPFRPALPMAINEGRFPFPVSERAMDDRLRPGETVLGVEVGGRRRAYPLERMGTAAANDRLGGKPIVVLSAEEGPAGAAFVARAGGRRLTFGVRGDAYVDDRTGSTWTLAGEAIAGPLAGASLRPLPVRTTFWFALVAAFPDVEVHVP